MLLKAAGTAADLVWATFSSVFVFGSDARGDIATRGASAYGRLALGANAKALVSDGTDAIWDFVTTVGKSATDTTYDGGVLLGANAQETLSSSTTASATKTWHNVDTSGAAWTIILPDTAATNSLHTINDSTRSFATNSCTVSSAQATSLASGASLVTSVTLNIAGGTWVFKKTGATTWQLLGGAP
jgi:hypothetical protein